MTLESVTMKKLFEKLIIDKFFIPLLFLAPFSGTSFADNQTSTFKCPTWDMHEIQVPVDAHSRDNREFSFKFQWIQKNVDSPTIIFVPGGPGSGSISESTVEDRDEVIKETYEYLGVPDTFNLILTDPRAVGCNGDFRFEEGDLSSELFADDLVAMIKSTGIKDYILYAHSYGTVLATIGLYP